MVLLTLGLQWTESEANDGTAPPLEMEQQIPGVRARYLGPVPFLSPAVASAAVSWGNSRLGSHKERPTANRIQLN